VKWNPFQRRLSETPAPIESKPEPVAKPALDVATQARIKEEGLVGDEDRDQELENLKGSAGMSDADVASTKLMLRAQFGDGWR
jgi:hypothetical protein